MAWAVAELHIQHHNTEKISIIGHPPLRGGMFNRLADHCGEVQAGRPIAVPNTCRKGTASSDQPGQGMLVGGL